MRTLILCGGQGTRAYPATAEIPKALVEVGGRPVLRHVMEIFARQGRTGFVLAAGHLAAQIEAFAAALPEAWTVEVVDTGVGANTGDRVRACAGRLGERFFLTYADGLGNLDLGALLAFHDAHAGAATVTTVPLPSPYGTLDLGPAGEVRRFNEKPVLVDHPINAGFFVLDRRAFEHWCGADLEREVLPGLGEAGELYAYRHAGFWRSLDTYKDALELSELCGRGEPPWLDGVGSASGY